MTDETNNTLRAVFLAALMVLWVFAGTVALAGSAAAIEGDGSIENADVNPQNDRTDAQNVTYNSSFDYDNPDEENNTAGGVEVDLTDASGGTAGGSVNSDLGTEDVIVTKVNDTGPAPVPLDDVRVIDKDEDGTDDTVQANFEENFEPDDGATLLVNISNGVNNPAVEDTYEGKLRSGAPTNFGFSEAPEATDNYEIDDAGGDGDRRDRNTDDSFGGGKTRFKGQILDFQADTNGGQIEDYELRLYTPGDRNGDENIGALITQISLNDSEGAQIETENVPDNERVVITAQGEDENGTQFNDPTIVEVNEDGEQQGFDTGAGGNDNADDDAVEIVPQTLSTEFESDTAFEGDNVTLEVDSNRDNFDLFVDSDNLSQSELTSIIQDSTSTDINTDRSPSDDSVRVDGINETGSILFNFDDTGNFSFDFEVQDTTANASAEVEVEEEPDADAEFASDSGAFTVKRGDIQSDEGDSDSTISIETTDIRAVTVTIGDEERNNYETALVVEPNDDGEIEIRMNTFLAGNVEGENVTEAYEVTEGELVTANRRTDRLTGVLDEGQYDLTIETRQTEREREVDAGVLNIRRSSYESLDQLRHPDTSLSNADEVSELSENEDLSETEVVTLSDRDDDRSSAERDLLIHRVNISGVFGAFDAIRTESTGAGSLESAEGEEILREAQEGGTALGSNGEDDPILNLTLEQVNFRQNREPKRNEFTDPTGEGFEFVIDEDNETVYLVTDVQQIGLNRSTADETNTDEQIETGDLYRFEFNVGSGFNETFEGGIDEYAPEESTSVNLDIEDRTAEFDTGDGSEVRVEPAEDQEIAGTTNVAPGTNLTIAVDSSTRTRRNNSNDTSELAPVFQRADVEVQDDGSFGDSTFDFSDNEVGRTFVVTATRAGIEDSAETDGRVIEGRAAQVAISETTASTDQDEVSTITVDSGFLPEGGFITIHDGTLQDGATFDSVRGSSEYLEEGNFSDVEVELDDPYVRSDGDTQTAIAMPHRDTNDNEEYDFVETEGGEDGPYTAGDAAVTDSASVTFEQETPTPEPSTPTPTPTPEPTTPTPTETPTDQPGFGAVLALIALIGAALLAARRTDF
ncbi:hypothetical protein BRD02_11805 [Halobacteriales archaeon QS_8_69_73]|nr:MAG: hypothetical protein BRD02_11805 [Halobacteriales archaeon QS_8_69_73]